ncbi:MAG TPA: hypothetical protein VH596_08895 [Terriglobales bacterium]|jgi:hypothetical protein
MKYIGSALVSLFVFVPMLLFAGDNTIRSVNIPSAVVVNHHTLKAGHYKVEWQQPGPNVEVNFLQHGKTMASAPGTLKVNDAQIKQDDIITNRNALMEIDFGHQKEAIVFPQKG